MQINSIAILQPFEWLKKSWQVFINNPMQWILIFIVFFICALVSNLIPLVGSLVFMLLSPALMAGIFLATEKSASAEAISINDLFSIVLDPEKRMPFILLGVVIVVFNLLVMMVIFVPVLGGAGLAQLLSADAETISAVATGAGIGSAILVLLVTIVYLMAMVYAIPLMLFANQDIKSALLLSIKASASNFLAMLLLSIIYLILFVLAMIPLGLGFLVLLPMTFGLIYVSYQDIFS